MESRGFTLVELLAVIIVIGLIASFALPQVLNQFSNQTEELSNQQEELLKESVYSYILEHKGELGNSGCFELKSLVDNDVVDENFAKQIENSGKVKSGICYTFSDSKLKVYFKEE